MSDNVGTIDFRLSIDGAKSVVESAAWGEAGGEAYSKAFESSSKNISISGDADKVSELAKALLGADESTRKLDSSNKKLNKTTSGSGSWYKGLSQNTRQVLLWGSAIAAGASDIAGLGAAAGGGIAILLAATADLAIGVGVAAIAFKGMTGDISKLPTAVQPAAKALQSVGDAFKTIQKNIQVSVFEGTEKAFDSLHDTVLALSPALESVGKQVNGVIKGFAAGIAPGTDAFKDLTTVVTNAGPVFAKLAKAAGTLGKALLAGLANKAVNKAVNDLADGVNSFADAVLRFAKGPGLTEWMDHTESVFEHLTPLIKAAAKVLNDLVTDESIKRLDDFLDDLTDFMPTLGSLLDIASRLDVFGLIAQALKDIGDVLKPLIGPLGDLADGLHRVVSIAIDQWAKDLKPIADGLAPVVKGLGEFFKTVDPNVIKDFANALLILAGALVGAKLLGALGTLTTKVFALKTAFTKTAAAGGKFGTNIAGALTAGLSGAVAGAIASQVTDGLTKGFAEVDVGKINVTPAAQGAINQFTGTLAGAAAGAKYGGPVGAMVGGFAGALASVDWGVVTKTLTDPNFKGTKAIEEGLKQGPAFAVINAFKDPKIAKGLGEGLGYAFNQMWDFVGDVFKTPYEWVGDNIIIPIINLFAKLPSQIVIVLGAIGQTIGNLFNSAVTWIADNVIIPIINFFTQLPANLALILSNIGATIGGWFQGAVTWIADNVIVPIINFFAQLPGNIGNLIGGIGVTIGDWFRSAVSVVSSVVGSIVGFFTGLPGRIGALIGSIGKTIGGWFQGAVSAAETVVDNIVGFFKGLPGRIMSYIAGLGAKIANALNLGNLIPHASGALVMGPQAALIGEAGPEMVVPLARPLNQVDPAVRQVAAFAQGKSSGASTGGGIGKQVVVEEGAIQVIGVSSPATAATLVLDHVVDLL